MSRWDDLDHNGPLLAPPYKPLPDGVSFVYDKDKLKLSSAAEEVACFFARLGNSDCTRDEVFVNNFFRDFRQSLATQEERETITDWSKCDFSELRVFFQEESTKKANLSKREKQQQKELKTQIGAVEDAHKFAVVNGKREKIANFRIEPPGLFQGRGDHPLRGSVRRRVSYADITVNCAEGKAPKLPDGQNCKSVVHDNSKAWLASWNQQIHNKTKTKYVWLHSGSTINIEKDRSKFDVARKLKVKIGHVQSKYQADWTSGNAIVQQSAVAVFLIDSFALRVGKLHKIAYINRSITYLFDVFQKLAFE